MTSSIIPKGHASNVPDWYLVAQDELGVKERPGLFSSNPRIDYYHSLTKGGKSKDHIAWCSSFVNYPFYVVGIDGTESKAARSWMKWGEELDAPVRGCVCVLWRGKPSGWKGHVGFWVRQDKKSVWLLGGNQRNAVTVQAYPAKRVLGYRWPGSEELKTGTFQAQLPDKKSTR